MGLLLSAQVLGAAEDQKAPKIFTVEQKTLVQPLFFSSIIQPIRQYNVSCPNEGVVIEKSFEYGQDVKKGQVLARVCSTKLEESYHNALTKYLSAKEQYFTAQTKCNEDQFLWEQGIIAKNEYQKSQSHLNNAHVSYLQALHGLNEILKVGQKPVEDITQLNIADIQAVDKALQVKYNHLNLIASEDGVALYPPESSGHGRSDRIEVGSHVKHSQVVTMLGDLNGIKLRIQVAEVDIDQIKEGQTAEVTGVAFPGIVLEAVVRHVELQASTDMGMSGGLPTFGVTLEVPFLTKEQRAIIRVGMSVKVRLNIVKKQAIEVPIEAVELKQGVAVVYKVLEDNQVEIVPVLPGKTTLDHVEIKKGLNHGDRLLVPH